MKPALFTLSVLAAGAMLHFLFLWMEGKGWIYYKRDRPSRTALGNAFLEVQSILEPDKKHVLEVRKDERRDVAESGDKEGEQDEGA